jgi:hypothetical protein
MHYGSTKTVPAITDEERNQAMLRIQELCQLFGGAEDLQKEIELEQGEEERNQRRRAKKAGAATIPNDPQTMVNASNDVDDDDMDYSTDLQLEYRMGLEIEEMLRGQIMNFLPQLQGEPAETQGNGVRRVKKRSKHDCCPAKSENPVVHALLLAREYMMMSKELSKMLLKLREEDAEREDGIRDVENYISERAGDPCTSPHADAEKFFRRHHEISSAVKNAYYDTYEEDEDGAQEPPEQFWSDESDDDIHPDSDDDSTYYDEEDDDEENEEYGAEGEYERWLDALADDGDGFADIHDADAYVRYRFEKDIIAKVEAAYNTFIAGDQRRSSEAPQSTSHDEQLRGTSDEEDWEDDVDQPVPQKTKSKKLNQKMAAAAMQ